MRNALKETVDQLPEGNVTLLQEINGTFPAQEVYDIVNKLQINIVYFPVDAKQSPGAPDMQFGQKLLRDSPDASRLPCLN